MSGFFKLISGWFGEYALIIAVSVVSLLLVALGAQTYRVHTARTAEAMARSDLSGFQRDVAEREAKRATIAFEVAQDRRATEQRLNQEIAEANKAGLDIVKRTDRVILDLRSQLVGLRGSLASYASGSSSGALGPDSLTSCQHRADALGDVLAETLQAEGERTAEAELEAARVRILLEKWPKITGENG